MELPTLQDLNLAVTLPSMGLALWACVVLAVGLFLPERRRHWNLVLSLGGIVALFLYNLTLFDLPADRQSAFLGMYRADNFTAFVNLIALVTAFFGVLMAYEYLKRTHIDRGEYYPLLLISTSGAMLMGASGDLAVLFVALELLSIPLYIMSGLRRPNAASEESALKYFLLGAFSSAFLVYGVALVYGAAGSTDLSEIFHRVNAGLILDQGLLLAGAGLMLVGLGFKVAAVPFHMWTPDVYQGAPTAVTGYMSVGAKLGGFAGLLRVFIVALPAVSGAGDATGWQDTIALIAALTMILGNVVAIAQRDVKRMLGYSSIAHAGYILMGAAAAGSPDVRDFAVSASLFYLLAYAFTNLGAFAVTVAIEKDDATNPQLDDFNGLSKTRPVLALAMALFMLSLTGIPPTAGVVGKFFLFQAAVNAGMVWLALIGVITSVVSAFYYLRIVVNMYLREGPGEAQAQRSFLGVAVGLAAVGTFVLGVAPVLFLDLAQRAVLVALGG
ncbi:MAG: NADH-quinone oxidoreductase subunit N [Anaerolineae bacterium]|nr:NADH-quinone oxidoreductase subunit N [Anaerolineae bacterium]